MQHEEQKEYSDCGNYRTCIYVNKSLKDSKAIPRPDKWSVTAEMDF